MSYSSRKRYKSRREKNYSGWKKFKVVILFIVAAALILIIKNWVAITNHLGTYFY
ncbi:MAG: hypothetical protein HKN68_19620 [Saprospiraceae bacterium]|nr:hypothetical protein [Saprospiraceae bacterium]